MCKKWKLVPDKWSVLYLQTSYVTSNNSTTVPPEAWRYRKPAVYCTTERWSPEMFTKQMSADKRREWGARHSLRRCALPATLSETGRDGQQQLVNIILDTRLLNLKCAEISIQSRLPQVYGRGARVVLPRWNPQRICGEHPTTREYDKQYRRPVDKSSSSPPSASKSDAIDRHFEHTSWWFS